MKNLSTNIKFSKTLAKWLYPITMIIGCAISLTTPATFYLIESQSLQKTANLYAEDLGDDFEKLAQNESRYWKYQTKRFQGILSNFAPKKHLVSIRIKNLENQPIRGYKYQNETIPNWQKEFLTTGQAPIIFNNRQLGIVEVTISETNVLINTTLIFLVSTGAGIALALLAYRFPLAISTRQEENSQQQLNELVQGLNAIVWEAEAVSQKFLFVSQAAQDILGYPIQKWFDDPHFKESFILPEDRQEIEICSNLEVLSQQDKIVIEYRAKTTNGTLIWLRDSIQIIKNENNQPWLLRGVIVDITTQKQAENQLRHLAFHDPLTKLLNRGAFMNELNRVIKHSSSNNLFAVLYLDLDRFKTINDSLGHLIGDRLLIAVGHKITASVRSFDKVGRLGGDEFVILLEQIKDVSEVTQVAQRIISQFKKPFYLNEQEIVVTTSIGIALSQTKQYQAEEILRDADNALYRAKNLGKNRYELFDSQMQQLASVKLQLETDLRRAIKLNQIEVFYQPIINIKEKTIAGFEALARWHHPKRGLVSPVEFIPIAEETGLILSLSEYVLETAARQIKQWQKQYRQELSLNVNISPIEFIQPNFTAKIFEILEKNNFCGSKLILEITESTLIKDLTQAQLIIKQLLRQNINIALDDFGTGYSSLSYLYQLPINKIKIDRSFVQDLEFDLDKLEVIRAIANLGNNLGINLVAEGIENLQQFKIINQLNCCYGQGYLFSQPITAEGAEALIVYEHDLLYKFSYN